ncbi:MAG: YraN family protein [Saprospiraceae bacterium]
MAAKHISFGKRGEDLACAFLVELEVDVLARNYRWSRAEVDIVAREKSTLHFVEVKTRTWQDVDDALSAVSIKQQQRVMNAASRYMEDAGYNGDFQFDVIVVLIDAGDNIKITWVKDAFGFWD